jgi:hypothetical protein
MINMGKKNCDGAMEKKNTKTNKRNKSGKTKRLL